MKYKLEIKDWGTRWYTFTEANGKGETLVVEVIPCHAEGKRSLPELWHKAGYTDRVMNDYLCVHTYVDDTEGNCYGRYNVTTKLSDDGKRNVIDFDWLLEPTDENINKIIKTIYLQFMSAKGKTATEERIDDIKGWAKRNKLKVVTSIPKGWRKSGYIAYRGAEWIDNGKSFRKGKEKMVLLV